MENVNKQLLDAAKLAVEHGLDSVHIGSGVSVMQTLVAAIAAAEQQAEPVAPGLYAILYRDNWDGEGDEYHLLAEYKDGKWLNDVSGKELLQYEGDAILRVWPLTDDKAQPPAVAGAVPDGGVPVPLGFLQAFHALAHNYSLQAQAPDHYAGTERDAFSDAYARCGNELAKLRAMLAAAPQATAEDFSVVQDAVAAPEGWSQQVFELCNDMLGCFPMTEAMMACMYKSTGDRGKYPNAADWLARAALAAAQKGGQ